VQAVAVVGLARLAEDATVVEQKKPVCWMGQMKAPHQYPSRALRLALVGASVEGQYEGILDVAIHTWREQTASLRPLEQPLTRDATWKASPGQRETSVSKAQQVHFAS
jgi:hypothetical protein